MKHPCVCGERGEGSASCIVFGHSPFYDEASWIESSAQLDIKLVEQGIGVNPSGEYFFWDETGTDAHGPYKSSLHAKTAQEAYADTL